MSVVLRTNVPYANGAGVALWSSRSGATTAPLVESTDPWLGDGEVGDVVVTPGDASKDSALTIRVAMGLRGKRAAECTDEDDITASCAMWAKVQGAVNPAGFFAVVTEMFFEKVKTAWHRSEVNL